MGPWSATSDPAGSVPGLTSDTIQIRRAKLTSLSIVRVDGDYLREEGVEAYGLTTRLRNETDDAPMYDYTVTLTRTDVEPDVSYTYKTDQWGEVYTSPIAHSAIRARIIRTNHTSPTMAGVTSAQPRKMALNATSSRHIKRSPRRSC